MNVKKLIRLAEYDKWMKKLKDQTGKALILKRIFRLARGNPGSGRFLGEIAELKIDSGPGYRVYYKDMGKEIILLLCGGDKSTQQEDIERAKKLARRYEEETNYGTN